MLKKVYKFSTVLIFQLFSTSLTQSNQFVRMFGTTSKSPVLKVPVSNLSFISSSVAKRIDEKLMSSPGFSIDQLMELAGLSVASAVHEFIEWENINNHNILVLCGPGNNGGNIFSKIKDN